MKIALFSDTFSPQVNGVAAVVHHSANALARLGHEVYVITSAHNLKHPYKTWQQENFTVISLPAIPALVYPGGYRLTLPMGLALRKLRAIKPNVIHTHTPFSVGWEAVRCARKLKIPLVGTHHTFYNHYLKHIKMDYAWAAKFSWKYIIGYYNKCQLVLNPTNALAAELTFHGFKQPITILPNPIDTELFRPVNDLEEKLKLKALFGISDQSIIYMGRISYEKNIAQLLYAFALVLKQKPGLKLMLVGDGPEKRRLEKLAEELQIKDNTIFTGFLYQEQLAQALQANDVFVTASKSENMPLSLLEAEACGLPIIAASSLGLKEIVKHNLNGFLVQPDSKQEMAEKILELLGSSATLEQFSAASRRLSEQHAQMSIAELLVKLYEQLKIPT